MGACLWPWPPVDSSCKVCSRLVVPFSQESSQREEGTEGLLLETSLSPGPCCWCLFLFSWGFLEGCRAVITKPHTLVPVSSV